MEFLQDMYTFQEQQTPGTRKQVGCGREGIDPPGGFLFIRSTTPESKPRIQAPSGIV